MSKTKNLYVFQFGEALFCYKFGQTLLQFDAAPFYKLVQVLLQIEATVAN